MDWATIIPVLVGSGVTLTSTVSVEYLRYRQTSTAANREHEAALRGQSRGELHALVTQVQDSLQEAILIAANVSDVAQNDDEAKTALQSRFREVTIGCIRLVSRLPDREWRDSVKGVIGLINAAYAVEVGGSGKAEAEWEQATMKYEQVMDEIAEPIQDFYSLALRRRAVT